MERKNSLHFVCRIGCTENSIYMCCAVRYLPPNELKATNIFPLCQKGKKYIVKSDKDEAAFSFYLCFCNHVLYNLELTKQHLVCVSSIGLIRDGGLKRSIYCILCSLFSPLMGLCIALIFESSSPTFSFS